MAQGVAISQDVRPCLIKLLAKGSEAKRRRNIVSAPLLLKAKTTPADGKTVGAAASTLVSLAAARLAVTSCNSYLSYLAFPQVGDCALEMFRKTAALKGLFGKLYQMRSEQKKESNFLVIFQVHYLFYCCIYFPPCATKHFTGTSVCT